MAEELNLAGRVELSMRVYFSSYHLWAARHFAQNAKDIEDQHGGSESRFDIKHRAYVTNAVLSAVAFMEAAINELFDDVEDKHPGYVDPLSAEAKRQMEVLWARAERRPLLEKYRLALVCAGAAEFDRSANPYQDAKLLVELRNDLVHARPETRGPSDKDKLAAALSTRFAPSRLITTAGNPYFPDKCLGAGCAAWAVITARGLADAFFERIKVGPHYQKVDFG
jgi:hypothetical protein